MAANTITKRVAEFLQKFPPFNLGTTSELQEIANNVLIQYREANEMVFEEGQKPGDYFYVVRQGSVKIYNSGTSEVLVDICDEGDIFGVRPLLANEPYLASAKTQEECLLYAIPVEIGKRILQNNAKVSLFFAMGYASGKPMQRTHITKASSKLEQVLYKKGNAGTDINETVTPDFPKKVLTCNADSTIENAAKAMRAKNVGSILVVTDGKPVGIITDKDLRNNVATGFVERTMLVSEIMSAPVITVPSNISLAACLLEMINHNVHHLCVTEDGTTNSTVAGIISDHDLLLAQGSNPAILVKEIKKTDDISVLLALRNQADELVKKYLNQEVSIDFIRKMITAVNDAVYAQLINLAIADLGAPPTEFCWINLGSSGREEQLLRTDQDHALIYKEEGEGFQIYFLELATNVSKKLEKFGFEQDVAEIGANHPKWCKPLSAWKDYFTKWLQTPDQENILLSNIFFDFRPIYGKSGLSVALANHLYSQLEENQLFLPFLAKNALTNPAPLSFFRNFMVEKTGEHKDEFDLKARALLPLNDAARVFTLQYRISGLNNTADRFLAIADKDSTNADLFKEAAHGYEVLLRLRGKFGFANNDSGRYIQVNTLDKLDRQTLRNVFSIIRDLQKILEIRFQLNYLR